MPVTLFCFGIKFDTVADLTPQNLEAVKMLFSQFLQQNGMQKPQPVLINESPAVSSSEWDPQKEKPASQKQIGWVHNIIRNNRLSEADICSQYHCRSIDELPYSACNNLIKQYGEKY